MLWFEQKVKIPDSEAFKLRLLLNLPVICSSLGIAFVFVGFLLLVCTVYKICTTNICGKEKKKYIYEEQQTPLRICHKDGVNLI